MARAKHCNQKTFYNNKYILDENHLLEATQKNSYYVPVFIRRRNIYEKENDYFQGLWAQFHNI